MMPTNGLPDGYKQNPNPPQIRFIRKNGRIIPIVNRKKVKVAADHLQMRLGEMKSEVVGAVSEGRSFRETSHGTSYSKAFSNYPDFYRSLKFKNKSDFLKALEGKTKKKDDVVQQAHEDLSKGYESSVSGDVPPDLTYKTATRQVFNNNGVTFRRIKGRIVPMKIKARKVEHDQVPF